MKKRFSSNLVFYLWGMVRKRWEDLPTRGNYLGTYDGFAVSAHNAFGKM